MLGGIIWWKELKQAGVVNTVKTMWLKQVELSFIERIIHWHESVSWCWDSWKMINNFPISSSNSEKTDSESVGDKSTWKCQLKWRLKGGKKVAPPCYLPGEVEWTQLWMKEWSRSHGYALTYLNISLSHWINTACCCCSFEPIHLLPPSHLTEPLEGHKVQVQCTQSHRAAMTHFIPAVL